MEKRTNSGNGAQEKMTREEAIKTLREDYCGNRIICELHPDKCNQEECEIWLAIKALETQPDGDVISRHVAIDAFRDTVDLMPECYARDIIADLPSAQPEETCDTCKYGFFGDGMCDYCRVGFPSNYERRTDE